MKLLGHGHNIITIKYMVQYLQINRHPSQKALKYVVTPYLHAYTECLKNTGITSIQFNLWIILHDMGQVKD
jgi:hypothetical protein